MVLLHHKPTAVVVFLVRCHPSTNMIMDESVFSGLLEARNHMPSWVFLSIRNPVLRTQQEVHTGNSEKRNSQQLQDWFDSKKNFKGLQSFKLVGTVKFYHRKRQYQEANSRQTFEYSATIRYTNWQRGQSRKRWGLQFVNQRRIVPLVHCWLYFCSY